VVKSRVYGGDWIDPNGVLDFPEELDIFAAVEQPGRRGVKKVMAIFFEPEGTRLSNDYVIRTQDRYELILTLDEEVLTRCPNARFFPFGPTWIKTEDAPKVSAKEFGVTMICGGKDWMPGHKIRRALWERQDEIKIPKTFWRSVVSKPPGHEDNPTLSSDLGDKYVAFGRSFHLAIENCKVNNYFTEKLCDCITTKTAPLYWGCKNVQAFFNANGMILLPDSVDEIINIINALTPADFDRLQNAINMNYGYSAAYTRDMALRVRDAIRMHLYADVS
jgi:hypothetical protein